MSDEEKEVVGNANEDRLKRMNQIADSSDDVRRTELQDLDGEVVERPVEEPEEPAEEEGTTERVEERKFKLKVNGREIELTEAELIERAQKVESADAYLQTASEAVKNATRLALPDKDEPEKVEEDDLALARALQMGSEEDAAKAIRKLRARPSDVTPDAVLKAVDERLQFRTAADWFNSEYKDLLDDPNLKTLVLQKDSQLAELEPTLPYKERLKRVGEEVRGWRNKVSGTKVDKLAKKASVAPVPSAAGRQTTADDEGEDDPEKVIAAMAAARKQERPIKH